MNTLKLINEVNDDVKDLFPGIDSSVLNVKPKKEEAEDDPFVLKLRYRKISDAAAIYADAFNNVYDLLTQKDAMLTDVEISAGSKPKSAYVLYSSFPWFKKYSESLHYFVEECFISKSSPLFKNIETHIRSAARLRERYDELMVKQQKIVDKIDRIDSRTVQKIRKNRKMKFDAYAKQVTQIPAPNPIPKKIPIKNKRPINNPYHTTNAKDLYAGHVALYPNWSDYWKDQIVQVNNILKRNGKGELGIMYASTHQNGGNRFNFVVTGANGNLTWRKYDPSPGAGQNWMFLDGKKINTSELLGALPPEQDTLVAQL